MEENTQLDPSTLQNLLGNSNTSLIPESLVTTLTVSFIVLNILGVLFFVFYAISLIRKWKVQSAVLNMQKDLAAIKAELIKSKNDIGESSASTPQVVPQPKDTSRMIANAPNDKTDS